MKQVVRDLAEEHTVLFSSHILGEVQDVCSRVIVIHRGALRADGAPGELVQQSNRALMCVRAQCEPSVLRELVSSLPGVVGDTVSMHGDRDDASLSCRVEPGADPTKELGARLQSAAIVVATLKLELPTLEEYFYSITDGLDHQAEQSDGVGGGVAVEDAAGDVAHNLDGVTDGDQQ